MTKSTRSISASTATGSTVIESGEGTVPSGGGAPNQASNDPAPIPFALTHRQANAEVHIDYTFTTGIKMFNSSILKLSELFEGEYKSVNVFNEKLAERAKKSAWMETGETSS